MNPGVAHDAVGLAGLHGATTEDHGAILLGRVLAWQGLTGQGSRVNGQHVTLQPLHISRQRAATHQQHNVSRNQQAGQQMLCVSVNQSKERNVLTQDQQHV